jgi:branched-chain amino acid aminotransferase
MYSSLSHFPIGSGLYWEIAAHHPKSVNIDQYVLSNADQQIVEAIGSNLYVIKNGFIKGASIQQGAYSDLTKPILLSIFKSLKFIYNETDGIILKDMQEAEEVFLCDALHGIRWAAGFESKRYFNQNIRKISEMFLKNI